MDKRAFRPGDWVMLSPQGTKLWLWPCPWSMASPTTMPSILSLHDNRPNIFVIAAMFFKQSSYQDVMVLLPSARIGWVRSSDLERP